MSKLHKRKGFTLTELAIVIAIIAVLIAVLVPTFYTLIKNAKESSDSQLTKNMNEAVSIEDATSGIETPEDAITAALSVGYSVENLSAKSEGNIIVYDQESKSFVLITEDLNTAIYNNTKDDYHTATTWLFLRTSDSGVVKSTGANTYTISGNNSYILIGEEWAGATITVETASGIDTSQVTSTASAQASSIKVITTNNNSQSAVNPVAAKTAVVAEESATVYPILYNVKNAYLKYTGGSNPVKIFGSTYVSIYKVSSNTNSITIASTVNYVDVTNSSNLTVDIESSGSTQLLAFGEVEVKNSSGTVISITTLNDSFQSEKEDETLVFGDLITVSTDTYTIKEDENGVKYIEVTAPTCTTTGCTKTVYVNNYTGTEITVVDKITPATGHTYKLLDGAWSWTDNETATATFTCSECDHTHTEEATITSEETTEATCAATGEITYTAKVTLNDKEYTATKTQEVAALGHNEGTSDKNDTPKVTPVVVDNEIKVQCTYTVTNTCDRCGEVIGTSEEVEIITLDKAKENSYIKTELYNSGNEHVLEEFSLCFNDDDLTEIDYNGYSGDATNVTIPTGVTSISGFTATKKDTVKSITIPTTVTTINAGAFKNCKALTSITIPESVTSIGKAAFSGCTALETLNYNAVDAEIVADDDENFTKEEFLFYNAGANGDGIAVTIGANVTEIPYDLFYVCVNEPNEPFPIDIVSIVFETGSKCTKIGSRAFGYCSRLTSIELPSSITTIGHSAFIGCSALESITIPDGVTKIEQDTFKKCTSLKSIIISDNVTSIGSGVFNGCASLESITLPFVGQKIDATNANTLFGYIFGTSNYDGGTATTQYYAASSTKIYYIPDSLTSVTITGNSDIPYGAFRNCTKIKNITISGNVESVGDYSFNSCSNLTNITLPSTLKSIGVLAFSSCTALVNLDIPSGVTSIGDNAFNSCKSLTSIVIPDGVTELSEGMFSRCYVLESITLPFVGSQKSTNTATYEKSAESNLFGYLFFDDCDDDDAEYLVGVTQNYREYISGSGYEVKEAETRYIPTSLKTVVITGCTTATVQSMKGICYGAFSNCTMLESVTIPDSAQYIGSYAFYGCTGLTSITIPENITNIYAASFYNCTGLTAINYNAMGNVNVSGTETTRAFYCAGQGASGITLTIGANVTKIPDEIFLSNGPSYAANITKLVFEDSNTKVTIGNQSFAGCAAIQYVYMSARVTKIDTNAFNVDYSGDGDLLAVYVEDLVAWCNIDFSSQTSNPLNAAHNLYVKDSTTGSYTKLTSLVIPDSVTTINDYAFYGCTSITSVNIGDQVTSIGISAFEDCTNLKTVTIGSGVEKISKRAFFETAITTITYSAGNTWTVTKTVVDTTTVNNVSLSVENLTSNNYYALYDWAKETA